MFKSVIYSIVGAIVVFLLSFLAFNFIDQDQLINVIFTYYPILLTVFFGSLIVCFTGFYNYYHEKVKALDLTIESLQSEIEQLKVQRESYKERCESLQEQYAELEIARVTQCVLKCERSKNNSKTK